jgi:CHASE3 domain sensor protein
MSKDLTDNNVFKKSSSSLKFRAMFVATIVILIVYSLYSFYDITGDNKKRDDILTSRAHLVSSIQSLSFAQSIWNMDDKAINSQLEALNQDKDYCGSVIIAPNGTKIASNGEFSGKSDDNQIVVAKNINFNNESIGNISICFSKKNMQNELREQLVITIIVTSILVLILLASCKKTL